MIGAMFLPGCKSCQKEDEPPPMPVAPEVTAEPPAPTTLSVVEPTGPGDVVRPELDEREDGITGTTVTVSGAKANLKIPSEWKLTKADVQVATSADSKSRLGFVSQGTDGVDPAVQKAVGSTGLSGCEWGSTQSLTVGKDKLVTQAADGKCKRGGVDVSAAYIATEGLVAVGSWDDGADRNELFGSLRSIAKLVAGTGGATNLVACCRALANNAKSAPPPQNGFMLQAAATCEAAARSGNAAAVNAALRQFGMKCN
jgi:hypothetical protein